MVARGTVYPKDVVAPARFDHGRRNVTARAGLASCTGTRLSPGADKDNGAKLLRVSRVRNALNRQKNRKFPTFSDRRSALSHDGDDGLVRRNGTGASKEGGVAECED